MRRLPRLLIGLIAAVACDSDPEEPLPPRAADLIGTYFLASADGSALPITTQTANGYSTTYQTVLTLAAGGEYRITRDFGGCSGHLCNDAQSVSTGEWHELADGSVLFQPAIHDDTGSSESGQAAGDSIVFTQRWVYRRVDPAATARTIDVRPDSILFSAATGFEPRNIFANTQPYGPAISLMIADTSIAKLVGATISPRLEGVTWVIGVSGNVRDSAKIVVFS
jgi:hypothetical protein